MKNKDVNSVMLQFDDDATWINSQGYFFEGKEELGRFHRMLAENDSLDYYYEAGDPRIRLVDPRFAMVYYSWKMFWFDRSNRTDTLKREIGLMTLSAQKTGDRWRWIAVTNQHTPWFYERIDPVFIE